MNNKKWFRIIVWVMLLSMIMSTLFVLLQPILFGL
ncbi:stressosome-associated protein Prli42 [Paenibacillus marinisediminis]